MKDIQPTYEVLDVKNLNIAEYQRSVSSVQVRSIVQNFDPKLLGVIKVSYDDGKYNVIDGQHRVLALKVLRIAFAMCEVHRGLSYEEEAELFSKQSLNRRSLRAGEIFKAKIEAQDLPSLELKQLVESVGFRFSYHGGKGKNQIGAITTLNKLFRQKSGKFLLLRTLGLIYACWKDDANATDAKIIQGVAMFIKEFEGRFDDKIFVDKLRKVAPIVIIRDGERIITSDGKNRCSEIIKQIYNKGNSEKKKLK